MRRGMANLPLHDGKCPAWLFARMKRLGVAIIEIIVAEFGPREVLFRLADPVWFQALGCVLGFDWHSSGVTTMVCGALKEGLREMQGELGVFIAGGKGRASRRTPCEIEELGESYGLPSSLLSLQYASRMAAKVDTAALQDGYDIYHHVFVFTADGDWAVVQQGMNIQKGWARRYHWLSHGLEDFVCEPHAAVACDHVGQVVNMVARESAKAREASVFLAREKPEKLLGELERMHDRRTSRAPGQLPLPFDEPSGGHPSPLWASPRMLDLPAPHAIPGSSRLEKALRMAYERQPEDFEELLALPGVGPCTVRALVMVAEVTYGVRASFRDPVRYSFAHGGKDVHPYPVNRQAYDHSIEVLEDILRRLKTGEREKVEALRRLAQWKGGFQ